MKNIHGPISLLLSVVQSMAKKFCKQLEDRKLALSLVIILGPVSGRTFLTDHQNYITKKLFNRDLNNYFFLLKI